MSCGNMQMYFMVQQIIIHSPIHTRLTCKIPTPGQTDRPDARTHRLLLYHTYLKPFLPPYLEHNTLTHHGTHTHTYFILPVAARTGYKTLMLAVKALKGMEPPYLQSLIEPYNPPCASRSANTGMLTEPFLKTAEH